MNHKENERKKRESENFRRILEEIINDKLDSDDETQGGFEGEKLKGKVSDKMDGLQ